MDHAVAALGISAHAVTVPVGLVHERLESGRVAFADEQVARPLPTEHVARGIAPGSALVTLVAGQEIQVKARVVERPAPAPP